MKLSVLAQLVALHAQNGLTSTKELAIEIGVSERHVRRAKSEIEADTGVRINRTYMSANRTQESAGPDTGVRLPPSSSPLKKGLPRTPSKEIHPPSSPPISNQILEVEEAPNLNGGILKRDSPVPLRSPEQLAAAVGRLANEEDSYEERYWKAAGLMEKAGVPRSMMGKLAKLVGEWDELFWMAVDISGKREPRSYLSKIIKNKTAEQHAEQAIEQHALGGFEIPKDAPPMPDYVREFVQMGRASEVRYDPVKRWWWAANFGFDEEGIEVAA